MLCKLTMSTMFSWGFQVFSLNFGFLYLSPFYSAISSAVNHINLWFWPKRYLMCYENNMKNERSVHLIFDLFHFVSFRFHRSFQFSFVSMGWRGFGLLFWYTSMQMCNARRCYKKMAHNLNQTSEYEKENEKDKTFYAMQIILCFIIRRMSLIFACFYKTLLLQTRAHLFFSLSQMIRLIFDFRILRNIYIRYDRPSFAWDLM